MTKPIQRCTRLDLAAGPAEKEANINAATAAKHAYQKDLKRVLPLLTDDDLTVGQVIHLL